MFRKSAPHRLGLLILLATPVLCLSPAQMAIAQHQVTIHNQFQNPSSLNDYLEDTNTGCTWEDGQMIKSSGEPFLNLNGTNSFHSQTWKHSGIFQNTSHKFSNWDLDPTRWQFKNTFDVYRDFELGSYFNITHSAYLRVTHEDEPGMFDANHPPVIKLKNPWDIRSTQSQYVYDQAYPAVFNQLNFSNSEWDLNDEAKGIFTGISRDPDRTNIPYYSLQVPKWYEDDGYSIIAADPPGLWPGCWTFIRWVHTHGADMEDVSENQVQYWNTRAVEFQQDNNYSTAWYKAHLFSNVTGDRHATSINSQRKIDVDDNGIYHATYESSGQIWYIKSTDGGNVWSPEELVSGAGDLNCHEPSIAEFEGIIYVAFISGDDEVQVSAKDAYGWNTIISEQLTTFGNNYPVVEVNNNCPGNSPATVCLVWMDNDGGEYWLKYAVFASDRPNILTGVIVSGYAAAEYPSIATTPMRENFSIVYKMAG